MFGDEGHQPVEALYQVRADKVTVIVTVEVLDAEDGVGAMLWEDVEYCNLLSQKEDARQGEPALPGSGIRFVQARGVNELPVAHMRPRVFGLPHLCSNAYALEKRGVEIGHFDIGEHTIFHMF